MVSAAILVGGIIVVWFRYGKAQINLRWGITVLFLIPQTHYPLRNIGGAPSVERTNPKLTIGIGIYRLLYQIRTKEDIEYDPLVLVLEGDEKNRPNNLGIENLFVVDTSASGIRDWWGNLLPISTPHSTRYLHHEDIGMSGIRIETKGKWVGKIRVEIRMKGKPIIYRYLQLNVSDNPTEDEIPFLKLTKNQSNWTPI